MLAAVTHAEPYPEVAKRCAGLLNRLGLHLEWTAQCPSARAVYEHALAITAAAYGPDHPEVAITLTNLGIVQQQLGQLDGARASQERAYAIFHAMHGPDHPDAVDAKRRLGGM